MYTEKTHFALSEKQLFQWLIIVGVYGLIMAIMERFQMSVVKPKPKYLLQPITTGTKNKMKQSEIEANTST